jgi:hypothetical protein
MVDLISQVSSAFAFPCLLSGSGARNVVMQQYGNVRVMEFLSGIFDNRCQPGLNSELGITGTKQGISSEARP